jgi:succinate dehydrogenase / fumarate reductase membrane anchor subunit
MVDRAVAGAHYGLRDWLAQRVTAVIMAVYTLIFLCTCSVLRASNLRSGVSCLRPNG